MKLVRAKEEYRKVEDKWLIAKKCTCCGRWLVASTDNFYKLKNGKYGLEARCKECAKNQNKRYREANRDKVAEKNKRWCEVNKEQQKQYRQANKEKIAEYQKQYRENNKGKRAECQKRWREANKEKIAKYGKQYREANPEYYKQYYENNKDKIAEHAKQYREDNKEKLAEQRKRYYENNRDKVLEQCKQYNEANKEKIAEQRKRYREANKEKIAEQRKRYYQNNKEKEAERKKRYNQTLQGKIVLFNKAQRRRAKQQQQGNGITKDQWLEMMKFFDFRCAYSGERLTKKTRSIDHIVPLNSGGDNMIWNMVPMTRSLNSSKSTKDMLEWYKGQSFYDPKRLAKIYEWQEYARRKWKK